MKTSAIAIVALILGFALGGWGPRSELQLRDAQLAELQQQLRKRRQDASPAVASIARMLNVPRQAPDPAPPAAPAPPAPSDDAPPPPPPAEATTTPSGDSFEARLLQASEIWALRSDLARDAFLTNLQASPEQTVRFDVLMEAMNLRIESTMKKWAAELAQESVPPNEAAVRMMGEIAQALVVTYDELDRAMPPDWRRQTGGQFELMDHIDPLVALPLAGLEHKLGVE